MNQQTTTEVVVIGAGAAGLLAAATAAERGRKVVLLEKNRKTGVKILMSGGTRCNITQATDAAGIVEAFGRAGRFLHSPLAALSPQDVVELFHAEGVRTKVESTGKVFPVSDKAIDVRDALQNRLRRSGAQLLRETTVTSIHHDTSGSTPRFLVKTLGQMFSSDAVVLTTGGQSYPGCGTTGDGYAWAKALGHRIVPPRPALVPITSGEGWVFDLQGVTITDAVVSVLDPAIKKGKPIAQRRGSLLFTHFGVSGPAVLDVSRAVTAHQRPQSLHLQCDFLPDLSHEQLVTQLSRSLQHEGSKQISNQKLAELPDRLWQTMLQLAEIGAATRGAEVGKVAIRRLAGQLKAAKIGILGTRGFKKAEVTAGGVDLREVDSKTMQSKMTPGLFLAGEILDLDGPIGGYNFQAAFSTGYLAGLNA